MPAARDLTASPGPDHPEHRFIIDPDKWEFYEMDAYRLFGDDERAANHARSVIRISTGPDGTEISPMRAAEARLTSELPPPAWARSKKPSAWAP
ncbi:hypothetical protein [Streptomyces sp. R35]|uniref:Uncharacterized protein n=1 Tax=Streptomyces sp. R35 TaxID=3238630 RepID=A0AB39SPI0_9ACTN